MKIEFDVKPVSGKNKFIIKVDGQQKMEWDFDDGHVTTNQWDIIPKLINDAYLTGIHNNNLEIINHGIRL